MRKEVVILGSTGSIGLNTCEILGNLKDKFHVVGISANKSIDELFKQVLEFKPAFVAVSDVSSGQELTSKIKADSLHSEIIVGADALEKLVENTNADIYVGCTSGSGGLRANLLTVEKGKRLALANKESLVCAGALFIKTSKEKNAKIIPVDSEHSAIFQAIQAGRKSEIKNIILTAR